MFIPTVIEKERDSQRAYDIYSKLLEERIIMLTGEVNDQMASSIIAQLLYLASKDSKKDIQIYVNSPGGSVTAGMGIIDTMNLISCDVSTICVGMAASMGAMILMSGKKGKRKSLPNAEVMIHQPLGGAKGQSTDVMIAAERLIQTREHINKMISDLTGQSLKRVEKDTDRDNYMTAKEALKYGVIDEIVK